MATFQTMTDNMAGLTFGFLVRSIFERSNFKETVVDLVRKRIYEHGTDVEGKQIRTFRAEVGEVYNRFTIDVRENEGRQTDHVDLFVTGAFYKTFALDQDDGGFMINYDDAKPDGNISDNLDLESVIGLAETDLEALKVLLIPELRNEIKKELLK